MDSKARTLSLTCSKEKRQVGEVAFGVSDGQVIISLVLCLLQLHEIIIYHLLFLGRDITEFKKLMQV